MQISVPASFSYRVSADNLHLFAGDRISLLFELRKSGTLVKNTKVG